MLEFELPPDQASRIFRHKDISTARTGRPRATQIGITWYDGARQPHAGHDLILAETHGTWRLERPRQEYGFSAGIETIREAPGLDALGVGIEGRPIPLAAFAGRARRVVLSDGSGDPEGAGGLAVTLVEGTMRSVTAERACCRVIVEGPPDRAARLAIALGETLPLARARSALPQQARLMGGANGAPASPGTSPGVGGGGRVSHAVPDAADVDEALAVVLGGLASALIGWLPEAASGSATGVHQARVAIRRLRSALLVFRSVLSASPGGDNSGDMGGDAGQASIAALRPGLLTLAARLGAARDWDVFLANTGKSLAAALGDRRLGALLDDAAVRRDAAYATLRVHVASRATQRLLLHLALLPALRPWRIAGPDIDPERHAALLSAPVATLAPAIVDRRFRRLVRGRRALPEQPEEALHDARKDAKKLRYALEFLSPVLARGETRRLIKLVSRVQDHLGAINDGAACASLMASLSRPARAAAPGHEFATGAVLGWLASRSGAARDELRESWSDLRQQTRFWRG